MGSHESPGRETGHRTRRHGHHRYFAHGIGDDPESGRGVDRLADSPAPAPAAALDAAAAAFEGTHQRHLVLHGEMLGVDALAQTGRVGRAALQREILAARDHAAALDSTEADHVVGRHEADQLVVVVVVRDGCGLTLLLEGAGIQNAVDALADGQSAAGVLLGDAFLAALLLGQAAAALDFPDFLFPAHVSARVSLRFRGSR